MMNLKTPNNRLTTRCTGQVAWPGCVTAIACVVITVGLASCSKKSESTPEAAAPTASSQSRTERAATRRPAQVSPAPTFAAKQQVAPLKIPDGVEIPNEHMPADQPLAQAIIDLSTGLLEGDPNAIAGRFDDTAKSALEVMKTHGVLASALNGVTRVRVCALEMAGDEAVVGLGVQRDRYAILLSLRATRVNNAWIFQGMTPVLAPKARDVKMFDGVRLADAPLPEPLPEVVTPTDDGSRKRKKGRTTSFGPSGIRI